MSVAAISATLLISLFANPGLLSAREFVVKDVKANSTPLRLPGSNSVICGAMVYSDLWSQTDANGNFINPINPGIFTIQAKPGGEVKRINTINKLANMRAGTKVNSLYYVIGTTNYDSEGFLAIYNSNNWSLNSSAEIDVVNVPSDLTYDPVSGNVYGFFWNDATQEYDRFCRFDTYYGEATTISNVDRNGFALAANKDGEIYGIWGYTGWLIKINPQTGRYEQIGKTGFAPQYYNSLTFDDATGKLYWCANDGEGYSALLEVNTSTGKATELMHFEDNASFAGIFAMPYVVPDNAPGPVLNPEVNFTSIGAVTGNITFTAPAKSHNGGSLSGPLTILVSVNGGDPIQVSGVQPGQSVTTDMITFPAGALQIEITSANDEYIGDAVTLSAWAGEDLPGVVTDLKLADVNGVPTLSWTAPAAGENGGVINPDNLSYKVVRLTDNKAFDNITTTTFVDNDFAGSSALTYEVFAVNANGQGKGVKSNTVVFGEGYSIPFVEGFNNETAFSLWTIVDLNGNNTWEYDTKKKNLIFKYGDPELEGDDWIISPKMYLEKGKSYALTFDVNSYYKGYPENLRVMLGTACDPVSMTQQIIDLPNITNTKAESKRVVFRPAESGVYYLGFYCYSIAHNWQLTLDNIGVEEVDASVPGAVTDLSVKAAPMGALKAEISCVAPTSDSKGKPIDKPFRVLIYRDDLQDCICDFDGITAGMKINYTDETITKSDMYTYKLVSENDFGLGDEAVASAFVGVDVPGAVVNLKAFEDRSGNVMLSWEAPIAGANGGWYDDSNLTYKVMRSNDASVVAEKLETTSVVDNLNLAHQELLYYLVTPYAGNQKGQYNNTPLNGVFGPSIIAPVSETFPGADMKNYPWVSESDGPVYVWILDKNSQNPQVADQNGDQGMAILVANETTKGITGEFTSPKFDISSLTQPELSFWFYHTGEEASDAQSALTLAVSADGGNFNVVPDIALHRSDKSAGWYRYTVDLNQYSTSQYIRLMFRAKADDIANLLVDNIRIENKRVNDVEVVSLKGASRVATGVNVDYYVSVSNNGSNSMPEVNLALSAADACESVQIKIDNLAADESRTVKVPLSFKATGNYNLKAEVSCQDDSDVSNNVAVMPVQVVAPIVAVPFDLSGNTIDGKVTLNWKEPMERGNVSDDFESYTDWAIDNIGEYLMIDADGSNTYHINNGLEYDNMSEPKAFQVCNADLLRINVWAEGTPHSGNKMMMAMASIYGANDDWMISPMLNGCRQTVSIHAKSFTHQDTPAEKMRVLYSTSTNPEPAVSDFILCDGGVIEVPDQWMQYRFVLPEGARRLAVNCVSEDAFALFVDDWSYNDLSVKDSPIEKYEIERDGVKVGESEDPSFIDTDAGSNVAIYRVRASHADGSLSEWSEPVTVQPSDVDNLAEASEKCYVNDNVIVIESACRQQVIVFSVDGIVIYNDQVDVTNSLKLPVDSGIYYAKTESGTYRLIVK